MGIQSLTLVAKTVPILSAQQLKSGAIKGKIKGLK